MTDINFYDPKEEYGFLSNFYKSPIIIDNVTYPTVEHYFQVMKFEPINVDNKDDYRWYQKQILKQVTAGKVKYLSSQKSNGRWAWHKPLTEIIKESIKRNVVIRKDWDKVRIRVMVTGVIHKFIQNPSLLKKLIKTYNSKLYEKSPRDSFWGTHKNGKNWLGKILECVRDVYIKRLKFN